MSSPELKRLPFTAASLWKERYESLRLLAMAGGQVFGADPLDLVLLLRQGMAGWMRSWSELGERASGAPVPAPRSPLSTTPQWQRQLTELLAQMSFAHLPSVSTL
jgi:hypothetical protein